MCAWLAKYNCSEICMESIRKYWILVFNSLEKADIFVVLAYPQYTKTQKGNKTHRKVAKWICDLFMCGVIFTISVVDYEKRETVRLEETLSAFWGMHRYIDEAGS